MNYICNKTRKGREISEFIKAFVIEMLPESGKIKSWVHIERGELFYETAYRNNLGDLFDKLYFPHSHAVSHISILIQYLEKCSILQSYPDVIFL